MNIVKIELQFRPTMGTGSGLSARETVLVYYPASDWVRVLAPFGATAALVRLGFAGCILGQRLLRT
jgi:hypothetical protein